jgi:hypothetical protein
MEGTYVAPSGKDIITNFLSCAAAIYLYDKAPGRYVAGKLKAIQDWGSKKNMSLVPTFGRGIAPWGGGRMGTKLVWYIR